MSSQIAALDLLIHELGRLPGIGEKTAQRLAYFILRSESDFNTRLQRALSEVQSKVHTCRQCFSYTDNEDLCWICTNPLREKTSICVVEDPVDIIKVESSGAFKGQYHVLQGAISPLNGVLPENLKIEQLLERIDIALSESTPQLQEVILALDADLEGDTTSLYISKLLSKRPLKLTRIAYGIPFGTDIDYIDRRTLGRALENRVEL